MASKLNSASSNRPTKAPTSLKEIEKFIAESTADFEDTTNYNDLKLQAYRTAFDAIMEELKTYRPILAKIKEAYDANLKDHRETKKELDQAQQHLLLVSESCNSKLAEHTSNQIETLKDANLQIENLKNQISESNENKKWFQAEIDQLKLELSKTYEDYVNERERRKILVSELRNTQAAENTDGATKALNNDAAYGDPQALSLQLKVTKEDLKRVTEELCRVRADYGDVVPRREFESQNKILDSTSEKLEKLQADFDKLHVEHTALLDLHQQIESERKEFCNEAELLRRAATPRPDWNKIRATWPEGQQDWEEKSLQKTSIEKVEIVSKQFMKSEAVTTIPLKQATEENPEIPVHLKWEGLNPRHPGSNFVHNRNFDRLEVSSWIDKIWKAKINADNKIDPEIGARPLSEIVLEVFQNEFNNVTPVVYEYTYSLDYALNFLKDEPYIKIFKDILDGTLHDSVKYRFDWVIANTRKAISSTASSLSGGLTKDLIIDSIKAAFPIKDDEDFVELRDEIEKFEREFHKNLKNTNENISDQQEAEQVVIDMKSGHGAFMVQNTASLEKVSNELGKYQLLFSMDDAGRYSNFLKLIMAQEERAKQRYLNEIEEGLKGFGEISFSDAKSHLINLDPECGKQLNTYLTVGFGKRTIKEAKNFGENISIESLMNGFRKTGIFRSGFKS